MIKENKGFTLVELMVVITILAILAAIIIFALNPGQLFARARDSQRFSDLRALNTAINYYMLVTTTPYLDNATNTTCYGTATTPTLYTTVETGSSTGWTWNTTGVTGRLLDGTGWLKINFTATNEIPLGALPWDPKNLGNSGSPSTFYAFACSSSLSFEINTNLESTYYKIQEVGDGGDISGLYEVGTSLTVLPTATSAGYYPNN